MFIKRQSLWLVLFAASGLVRCDCDDPSLSGIPKPEIDVVDVETGTSNAAVAEDQAFVIDFGAVDIGQSVERTVRISNKGTGQLHVTGFRLAESGLDPAICDGLKRGFGFASQDERATPMNIDPNQHRDVRIVFNPPAAGPHCMGLAISSDDADEAELLVYLLGQGSGGRLCAAPFDHTRVDFGPVYVGDTATQNLSFENCGNRAINLTGLSLETNPEEVFAINNTPTIPLAMEPGESFTMEASFTPLQVRSYTASLAGLLKLVTGEPYAAEQFISLEGIGAERPRCKITAVPTALNFGAVAGNAGQVDRDFLLKNNGECHCQVSSFSDVVMDEQAAGNLAGSFSVLNPPSFPFYLKGNDPSAQGCANADQNPSSDNQTITVRYTLPNRTEAAVERGHFDVNSDDPVNNPLTVQIEANGGGVPHCQLQVSPEAPDEVSVVGGLDFSSKTTIKRWGLVRFGNVSLHFDHAEPIVLENVGNYNCVIGQIKWRQDWTADNEFGFADENQSPITLPVSPNRVIAPGERVTYFATFKPTHLIESNSPLPNMSCLEGGYCAALTSSFGTETCLSSPCVWGNGIDIITGDGSDPLTADTLTDVSLTDAEPGTFSIGFMGKPTTPAIEVIPAVVDYGLITVGCGSEERTIKVYNTGSADLIVTRLEISPTMNPDEFRVTASMVPPDYTIEPGSSPMLINLRFLPRHEGLHNASLIIYAMEGTNEVPMFTVPLEGEGTLETHATDVFQQLDEPQVDVLWVVDDSGSMSNEQDILATNFPAFFSQTSINSVDYHIAVTTTLTRDSCVPDFTNPNDSCAGTPPDPMAGYYTACSGNDKWITTATSNPEGQFNCNVQVSDSGNVNPDRPGSDSAEGGLLAAKAFLSPPNVDDPNINGGFLREDAKLYVVMVSDEEDQSDGPTDLYVDFFRNLKGFRNQDLISVSAIAGDVPDGCTVGDDGAGAGARYKDVADAMGGLFQSICASDWSSMLSSLAFDSFGLKIQFFLSRGAASAASIEVCVADTDLTGVTGACPGTIVTLSNEGEANGWFYDSASNSVVFNPGSVPQRGQWIRADYDTACLPLEP